MEPILSPQETQRANELLARILPRLAGPEPPLAYLPLAENTPPPDFGARIEPTPPKQTEKHAEAPEHRCFESPAPGLPAELTDLLAWETGLQRQYRHLISRIGQRRAVVALQASVAEQRVLAKRLAAGYYLLCGQMPATAEPTPCPVQADWMPLCRALFHQTANAAAIYRRLADSCGDDCLRPLLAEASAAKTQSADALRRALETALPG